MTQRYNILRTNKNIPQSLKVHELSFHPGWEPLGVSIEDNHEEELYLVINFCFYGSETTSIGSKTCAITSNRPFISAASTPIAIHYQREINCN